MPEFNEFRQPNALTWRPEVPGTYLAYESQDAQRRMSVEANRAGRVEAQPIMDVTSSRLGDTLNFNRDDKGYFCIKVSGDDEFKHHYFNASQKWARLEIIDKNGHRVLGPQYDLDLQRRRVDEYQTTLKPVEAPQPVVKQPSHLEVTPAFNNVEQQQLVGKPLLPDQYNHWANVTEDMKYEFGKNQLSVLNMFAGLADKSGFMIEQQIQAMENYVNGTRNPDPKLRLQLAVMDIASAASYLIDKDSSGQWVFSVKDESQAGRKLQKAIDQLDLAVASSDSLKMYTDYGRTNNQARNLKAALTFTKVSLETGALKFLNGRSLPELLP